MEYEWDGAKAAANLAKHGVPFAYACRVFADPRRVEFDASRPRDGELRRRCVGHIDGKRFVVVFTERGDVRRTFRRAAPMPGRIGLMPMVRKTTEQIRASRLPAAQRRRLDAMTDAEITAAARSDPDDPPLTAGELARLRRGGRPPLPEGERKQPLTLRLPPRVISAFKETGTGYQARMGAVLERHVRYLKKGERVVHSAAKAAKRKTVHRKPAR